MYDVYLLYFNNGVNAVRRYLLHQGLTTATHVLLVYHYCLLAGYNWCKMLLLS